MVFYSILISNELAKRLDKIRSRGGGLFNSFAMQNKIRRADTFGLKYEIRGVPAFIVNGKYKVSASRQVGTSELLDVVDYLINLERK